MALIAITSVVVLSLIFGYVMYSYNRNTSESGDEAVREIREVIENAVEGFIEQTKVHVTEKPPELRKSDTEEQTGFDTNNEERDRGFRS